MFSGAFLIASPVISSHVGEKIFRPVPCLIYRAGFGVLINLFFLTSNYCIMIKIPVHQILDLADRLKNFYPVRENVPLNAAIIVVPVSGIHPILIMDDGVSGFPV